MLIKYSGKYIEIYFNLKITYLNKWKKMKMYTFLPISSPGSQMVKATDFIFFHWKANKISFSMISSLP